MSSDFIPVKLNLIFKAALLVALQHTEKVCFAILSIEHGWDNLTRQNSKQIFLRQVCVLLEKDEKMRVNTRGCRLCVPVHQWLFDGFSAVCDCRRPVRYGCLSWCLWFAREEAMSEPIVYRMARLLSFKDHTNRCFYGFCSFRPDLFVFLLFQALFCE